MSEFGRLDILLSNAGTGIRDSVREMTRDGFRGIMDLNLTAAFLMTKFALPHLEKTKGNILYISSSAGQHKREKKGDKKKRLASSSQVT